MKGGIYTKVSHLHSLTFPPPENPNPFIQQFPVAKKKQLWLKEWDATSKQCNNSSLIQSTSPDTVNYSYENQF